MKDRLECILKCILKSIQSCPTVQPYGLQPAKLLSPWDSPGKNTGTGCHALLQEIFLTDVSYVYLQGQAGSLPLAHLGVQS